MILNIPDPLAFFKELTEVSVIVDGKVTPEALYVLRKYEMDFCVKKYDPKTGCWPSEVVDEDGHVKPEYVPMAVPYDCNNPDGVD